MLAEAELLDEVDLDAGIPCEVAIGYIGFVWGQPVLCGQPSSYRIIAQCEKEGAEKRSFICAACFKRMSEWRCQACGQLATFKGFS